MYIKEVIVEGFKSYATRTVIAGWDPRFNAITGLNGSGKSNILDAICFVLGIERLAAVRASSFADLVYKRGQAGVTKASVTIVFDNSDASAAPVGYADAREIVVTRQVVLAGRSRYLVNGHVAPQHVVENLFQSVQLNVNNPHFLIMQGQVTRVLNMRPLETLALVEESAGTRMFEDHKAKAAVTLARKEARIAETSSLLAETIEPRLAELRAERSELLAFQRIEADAERLGRMLAARDLWRCDVRARELTAETDAAEALSREAQAESDRLASALEAVDAEIASLEAQRASALAGASALRGLEDALRDATNAAVRLDAQLCSRRADVVSDGALLEDAERETQLSLTALQTAEEAERTASMSLAEAQAAHDSAQNASREADGLLAALQTGVSTGAAGNGTAGASLAGAASAARDREAAARTALHARTLRGEAVSAELAKLSSGKALAEAERACVCARERITALEAELVSLGDAQTVVPGENTDGGERETLRRERAQLQAELRDARSVADGLRARVSAASDFRWSPSAGVDAGRVRGVVAELVRLSPEDVAKWGTALEVAAGGRLYNVVVSDAAAAGALLERGALSRRVTFVPLDTVRPRVVDAARVRAATDTTYGAARVALSLVSCEPVDVRAAMEHVFGATFLADTKEAAAAVAFDARIATRAVTPEGDVYEPAGVLSGGSAPGGATGPSLLEALALFRDACARADGVSARLSAVDARLSALERSMADAETAAQGRARVEQELALARRALDADASGRLVAKFRALTAEASALREECARLSGEADAARMDAERAERDAARLSADRAGVLAEMAARACAMRSALASADASLSQAGALHASAAARLSSARDIHAERTSVLRDLRTRLTAAGTELRVLEDTLASAVSERDALAARVATESAAVRALDARLADAGNARRAAAEAFAAADVESRRARDVHSERLSDLQKVRKESDTLVAKHTWLVDARPTLDRSFFADLPPDAEARLRALQTERDSARRRVNHDAAELLTALEERETSLRRMLAAVRADRAKIEATVETLSAYEAEALDKTFRAVNTDFGAILAELLPGAAARLETPDNGTAPMSAGLEIRVRLGAVWKTGLAELSGGQRSLVALALILALLRFKPAPVYILDEVDAALDLAHTEAIGRLLRSGRFRGAQFVVVSLKEGMFANANVLFRTRFRDGVSSVERFAGASALPALPADTESVHADSSTLARTDGLGETLATEGTGKPLRQRRGVAA